MKINYNLDISDIIKFSKFHFKKNKSKNFLIMIIFLGAAYVFFLTSNNSISNMTLNVILSRFIWVFVFLVIFFILIKIMIPLKIKKMNSSGDGNIFTGEHIMEIVDDYLIEKHKGNEKKVLLKNILKVYENDDYLFLYDTSISSFLIPKKQISIDIINEIKHILLQNIDKNKLYFMK